MTASSRSVLPYGSWPSSISAQSLVEGVIGLSALSSSGDCLYWLESRPEDAGRTVLVRSEQGSDEGAVRELTPAPYNVRSRVHEYGGGAYRVCRHGGSDSIYFVNFSDQNIYRIDQEGGITQLTDSDSTTRFADFAIDEQHQRLIAVVEQHHGDREPDNYLGAVDLASGALTTLTRGHDFYAAPRLSTDGSRLAFIAWDHPNMPWDGTMLQVGQVDSDGSLTELSTVAGGSRESVLQPVWQTDNALLFISDSNGYWNLYRYDSSGIYCVLEDGADYADPPWVFDLSSYTLVDAEHVLITRHGDSGQEVVLINTVTTMATPFSDDGSPWCHYSSICVQDGAMYFIGSYSDRSPTIERLPLRGGESSTLRVSGGPQLNPQDVSRGEAMRFPTRDGFESHAFFYPPANPACCGPGEERPPLLVLSHGGPTSATGNAMSLRTQYYTSRGWAVLDVNYRGSTGYGQAYRRALNGRWGQLDVTDSEDGVRYLARQQKIDPERVAIRGGSAGGYTTLRALTSTSCFRAGASHYGIGDLNALASDTHKFESRYLDGLLGDPAALTERSPIHHLDQFSCPVIFFQGSEDKVVPPNQSEAMVNALRSKGIPVAYLEFEGEGHGFRNATNIIRTAEAEYGFFARVFGIVPADNLPAIEIDNSESL